MKRCGHCKEEKDESSFGRDRYVKDGRNRNCRQCIAWFDKRKRERNLEQFRALDCARQKARYLANPEKYRAAARVYRLKTLEARAARHNTWREKNREYVKAYWRTYYQNNITDSRRTARVKQATRRALKVASGGKHTAEDIVFLRKRQKNRCAHSWCRKILGDDFHVDHIVPLSGGGGNDRKNLQLLCEFCNLSKGAKHPIDFAQAHGVLL
jgi:5-methylcytosine-specific restriction endonuclease McrA